MNGVSVNPNSIHVSMVRSGCLRYEFDSTYPIHLNGIISQHEYQESINKINRTMPSNRIRIFLGFIVALCIISGGITIIYFHMFGYPRSSAVGFALLTFGSIFAVFGCYIIQSQSRERRMRKAIAKESMRYSSRSLIACSWRLQTTTYFREGSEDQNNSQIVYHLVIDINRSIAPGSDVYYSNQIALESVWSSEQQDNSAPPPYPGPSTRFCSQCGASRQDLSAKFCSSCGILFNEN